MPVSKSWWQIFDVHTEATPALPQTAGLSDAKGEGAFDAATISKNFMEPLAAFLDHQLRGLGEDLHDAVERLFPCSTCIFGSSSQPTTY